MPDPRIWPIESAADGFFTVTFESQVCLAANPSRGDSDLTNDSDDWIYLARGNDAVVGSGIPLSPNGGSYHIGTNNLFLGDVYAIADIEEQEEANLAISEGNIA
ncbi:MAG: hypothetical protein KAJ19_17350 [Gammaproteobacteria bacterium]|nr:hypothetical protein [Gammaproteobacteria bacterium]